MYNGKLADIVNNYNNKEEIVRILKKRNCKNQIKMCF